MRVMIFDDSHDDFLETSWRLGAKLYKLRGDLDRAKGVTSLEQALNWLIGLDEPIDEIQFWGHGTPGRFYIGKNRYGVDSLAKHKDLFDMLAEKLEPESLLWFRTCSTFAGTRGHEFAKAFSAALGCRVAAFTFIIGLFQSGLHSITPGQNPSWDLREGLEPTDEPAMLKPKVGWPWSPHTISCFRSSIPKGW